MKKVAPSNDSGSHEKGQQQPHKQEGNSHVGDKP